MNYRDAAPYPAITAELNRDPTSILRHTVVRSWHQPHGALKRWLEAVLFVHTQHLAPLDIAPALARLRPAAIREQYDFVTLAQVFERVCDCLAHRGIVTHYGMRWVTDAGDRKPQPYLHSGAYTGCPICDPPRLRVEGVIMVDTLQPWPLRPMLVDSGSPHGRIVGG